MENQIIPGKENIVQLVQNNTLGELIKPLSREIHLFDSYIAGTSYIKDEEVFDDLKEGDKVILMREPNNHFDEKAILVLDTHNRKLGYVPEVDNTVFSKLMDAGKCLIGKVTQVGPKGSFRQINISIYMVDF